MESVETTLGDYLDRVSGQSLPQLESQGEAGEQQVAAAAAGGGREIYYGANNLVPPELIGTLRLPPFFPAHTKRLLDTRLWIGPTGCGVHVTTHAIPTTTRFPAIPLTDCWCL